MIVWDESFKTYIEDQYILELLLDILSYDDYNGFDFDFRKLKPAEKEILKNYLRRYYDTQLSKR